MKKILEFVKKINIYEIIGICVLGCLSIVFVWLFRDKFNVFLFGLVIFGFPLSIFSFFLFIIFSLMGGFQNYILNTIIGLGIWIIPIVFNGYMIGRITKKILRKNGVTYVNKQK